jgi:hypothetical protein
MKMPQWIRDRIQRDPESPLVAKEIIGLILGILYLLLASRIAIDIITPFLLTSSQDKELHKKCVLISSEIAKGSDSSYRATYDLCIKGDLESK